jgi:hypothetical protein
MRRRDRGDVRDADVDGVAGDGLRDHGAARHRRDVDVEARSLEEALILGVKHDGARIDGQRADVDDDRIGRLGGPIRRTHCQRGDRTHKKTTFHTAW